MEAYVSQNVNYALDFVIFSQFACSIPENDKINAFWYFLKHWYHMNLMWTFTLARKAFFFENLDILVILTRMVQNNALISKNPSFSDIPNQLMTKYTKAWKSTDIYSLS